MWNMSMTASLEKSDSTLCILITGNLVFILFSQFNMNAKIIEGYSEESRVIQRSISNGNVLTL